MALCGLSKLKIKAGGCIMLHLWNVAFVCFCVLYFFVNPPDIFSGDCNVLVLRAFVLHYGQLFVSEPD